MKLYIKVEEFSWRGKFSVLDETGAERYFVEGERYALWKKLHVYDSERKEVAFLRQAVFAVLPKVIVSVEGKKVASVARQVLFYFRIYKVKGLDWFPSGAFWLYDYQLTQKKRLVMKTELVMMPWGNCFELDIENPEEELTATAIAMALNYVISDGRW